MFSKLHYRSTIYTKIEQVTIDTDNDTQCHNELTNVKLKIIVNKLRYFTFTVSKNDLGRKIVPSRTKRKRKEQIQISFRQKMNFY